MNKYLWFCCRACVPLGLEDPGVEVGMRADRIYHHVTRCFNGGYQPASPSLLASLQNISIVCTPGPEGGMPGGTWAGGPGSAKTYAVVVSKAQRG